MEKQYSNVTRFRDRHGKDRLRFRKTGLPIHYFDSPFGTREFEAEWRGCFDGSTQKAKASKRKKPAPTAKGVCVYFIGADVGPVKIGFTKNIPKRLDLIQGGYPERLKVLALAPGGRELEAHYHRQFFRHRMNGEWFRRAPEIEQEMAKLAKRLDNPAKVIQL